jgi:hypothetical protein
MYHINEIRKQNAQKQADLNNAREGTFCVLRDGSVLLRNGVFSKTIDDKADAASFLERVRDQSTGVIKGIVKSYFEPVPA